MPANFFCSGGFPRAVEVWSMTRLPFEPKGDLLAARNELRLLLRDMKAEAHEVLQATYTTEDTAFFDVENVLLYNVGTGAFAKAARNGVRFLRRFGSPPRCPTFPDIDFKNYHRYELTNIGSESSQVGRAMAQVVFTMEKFDSATKPHEVWWAVRQGTIEMLDRLEIAQSFGVKVSANAPTKSLNTVALIKPLFDGIICALHCQKGELDGQASQWLAHALDADETTIRDQLLKQSEPLLGDRANLIMPYRTGVKWNPADERCHFGELLIRRTGRPDWSINAEVIAL